MEFLGEDELSDEWELDGLVDPVRGDTTRRTISVQKDVFKFRKEAKTWKIRFAGPCSNLTIGRFLARIEWHAWRAPIPLDELIGVLDLCLEDEALDWFWTLVDRYPSATWNKVKREMLLRFETSRTDEDVRRILNARKQQFPKERFPEFYQAILGLASQAKQTMSDNVIYTNLRRNMRPGLKMALYDEKNFRNLSEFVRRCSSLEEMWRRFGYNPEAGMSSDNQGNSMDIHRFPFKRQEHFDTRSVKIEEMTYLETEPAESYFEECQSEHDTPGYYQQVGEIGGELKVRSQDQGCYLTTSTAAMTRKTPYSSVASRYTSSRLPHLVSGGKSSSCWNCEDPFHFWKNCRHPNTSVFCFGCGRRGVFKLDCDICTPGNGRSEMWRYRDPHQSPTDRNLYQSLHR